MKAVGKGHCSGKFEMRLAHAVLFFCLLLAIADVVSAEQHGTTMRTSVVETSYVLGSLPPAYGNLSLPEPTLINDYLRTNTTLRNYLLPSNPPLQLIKCEAYILQMGVLFNFYVVEHTIGCQVPPPMVPWPESVYSDSGRFWLFTVRRWLCSWPGALALVIITICSLGSFLPFCKARHVNIDDLICCLLSSFLLSMIVSQFSSIIWLDELERVRNFNLPLPDVEMNPFLQISNISLSLHRCKATTASTEGEGTPLFDFYIGMPEDMCSQILAAGAPYGNYLLKGPRTWNVESIYFLSLWFPLWMTLFSTAILFCEVIYLACLVMVK